MSESLVPKSVAQLSTISYSPLFDALPLANVPVRNYLRADLNPLSVRAKGQQTPVAILDHKLSAAPGYVAKISSEHHAPGCVLGIERV